MPVTPYHFGPAFLGKVLIPRHFSLRIFAVTQVIIDAEVLWFLLMDRWPHHRFFHTLLGVTAVAFFSIVIGRPACMWLTERWNRWVSSFSPELVVADKEISWSSAGIAALFGGYSQVLLDSFITSDVQPFAPFRDGNPLLDQLSFKEVYFLCILTFLIGAIIFMVRNRKPTDFKKEGT